MVLGAADSVLGAVGVGATRHGDVAVIAGTSAIVLGVSDGAVLDDDQRYLVTPLTGHGWGLEMDLLAVGSAFDGIARLLGLAGPAALLTAAEAVAAHQAPLFLPYVSPGEQGALWDPEPDRHPARADSSAMSAGHVGRGAADRCADRIAALHRGFGDATGRRGPILLGGGAAASPLMWQDLADATGREVLVDAAAHDHSALGAALFAAASLGVPLTRTAVTNRIAPRQHRSAWWADAADSHDALRATLQSDRR